MMNDSTLNFERLVDALLDTENPFPPKYLKYFSDLEREQIVLLDSGWKAVPNDQKRALLADLLSLGRRDTLLSFEAFGRYVLGDDDPSVRTSAVQILWEYESSDLAEVFTGLCEKDPDAGVRAAAASGLGRFIYAGELERISMELKNMVEACLTQMLEQGETPREQQEALISLGYLNKKSVIQRIEKAYSSRDEGWIASSVYAMGRSANDRWIPDVLEMLENRSPKIRAAAAYAAGELEAKQALPFLFELLEDPDDQVQYRTVTALAQIGGEKSRKELTAHYQQAEDPYLVELLEDALERIDFWEEIGDLPFLDYLEDEGDDGELSSLPFVDEDDWD